jgi:DNA mismatch repair protein MutL
LPFSAGIIPGRLKWRRLPCLSRGTAAARRLAADIRGAAGKPAEELLKEYRMGSIIILDEKTANQIAAGEVIERPASVVKEMAENAIDAGATAITVEIRNGGISYIRVTDNGCGMEADDVELAFERHATSKLKRIEDLDSLATMGFRGEALASIAAVSRLEVRTKTRDAQAGTLVRVEGGRVVEVSQAGCPVGSSFTVRDLFFNTPARYKFLRKDSTEAGYVSDMISKLALAHPEISFKLISNQQTQLHTPGNNDLLSAIYSVYGSETAKAVVAVRYESSGITVLGYAGKPETARGTRSWQSFILNGRTIRSRILTSALEDAYKTVLMQNKFPFCVISLKLPPTAYDVNVHPQKLEVRFSNEGSVYGAVYHAVHDALSATSMIREAAEPVARMIDKKTGPYHSAPGQIKIDPFARPDRPYMGREPGEDPIAQQTRIPVDVPQPAPSADKAEVTYRPAPPESPGFSDAAASMPAAPEGACYPETPTPRPVAPGSSDLPEAASHGAGEGKAEESGAQVLLDAEIVGQAFDTYIIMQHGDNLYMIDQHAAHERIRYETLKRRLEEGISFSQPVLEPYIMKLSHLERDFILSRIGAFEKAGFEIEEFGPDTIIIRSIPDIFSDGFSLSDFSEILDRWMESPGEKAVMSDAAVYMMACRSAIKANRRMSGDEITALIRQLCSMENPYTCVHGRPVIISISRRELEKRFRRIV